MGCLFALFAGIFPRLGLFIIWIARPALVNAAFDTFIWPLLGIVFRARRSAGSSPATRRHGDQIGSLLVPGEIVG